MSQTILPIAGVSEELIRILNDRFRQLEALTATPAPAQGSAAAAKPAAITDPDAVHGAGALFGVGAIPRVTMAGTLGPSAMTDDGTHVLLAARNLGVGDPSFDFGIGLAGTYVAVTNTAGNAGCFFGQSSTANANMDWQYNATPANATFDIGTQTANALRLKAANAIAVTILPGGTVGIGDAAPGEKLSIISADNAAATNILAVRSNNSVQGLGFGYSAIRQLGSGGPLALDGNGAGAIIMQGVATGYVGVGGSPGYKFDVAGDINTSSGVYRANGSAGIGNSVTSIVISLAKLTTTGAAGSITVKQGIVIGYSNPT